MRIYLCDICGKKAPSGELYSHYFKKRRYDLCSKCNAEYDRLIHKACKKADREFFKRKRRMELLKDDDAVK